MPAPRRLPGPLLLGPLTACLLTCIAAAGCGGRVERTTAKDKNPESPTAESPDGGHAHDGPGAHSHDGGDDPAPMDVPIVRHEPGNDTGPHDGVVARLSSPDEPDFGWIEAKLHDDKGDIELWLARDRAFKQPLDLPLDVSVGIVFPDRNDRRIVLKIRNAKSNEDEDGTTTIRKGRTNYFIFPGDSGADAGWLKGASFRELARVQLHAEGHTLVSDDFELRPHGHGAGHGHAHDVK